MLSFALICPDLPSVSEGVFCPELCHQNPKRGKIRQIDAVGSSKNVVRIGVITTKVFVIHIRLINRKWSLYVLYNFNQFTNNFIGIKTAINDII